MPRTCHGRMARVALAAGFVLLTTPLAALGNPAAPSVSGSSVDIVLVDKGDRMLHLVEGDVAIRSYRIALGRQPEGPKRQQGDGRTPEGLYRIDWRNPESRFHLSLHISYPNDVDRAQARHRGVSPGGHIMIHGLPNGVSPSAAALHPRLDWTEGCIALTNEEIEEVWELVEDGTPVLIRP